MKSFKSIVFFILGLIISQQILAQENFVPGYVIDNNNDTIQGLVDYRNWANNPKQIRFKANTDSQPISYTPTEIIEFRVNGELYKSAVIQVESSPRKTEFLRLDPDPQLITDTTFLQTLIDGEKSLHYYKQDPYEENFYIKQNGKFELLVYRRHIDEKSMNVTIENKRYIGQLIYYLKDCPSIASEIKNTNYQKNSLTKLFNNYYRCTRSKILFQREREKIKVESGFLAGVSITNLSFTGHKWDHLTEAKYKPSPNVAGGFYLDLIIPRSQRKWSVYSEVLYTEYQTTGKSEVVYGTNRFVTTEATFKYSYLKRNIMIRFRYPINQFAFFVNGGIGYGKPIIQSNYMKQQTVLYTNVTYSGGAAVERIRKSERSYILGTGAKFKKFSFEFRYELGNGMSEFQMLNSITERYYFLLSYRII